MELCARVRLRNIYLTGADKVVRNIDVSVIKAFSG